MDTTQVAETGETQDAPVEHKPMTPPTSEEGNKPDAPHSDLSDLDLDDDDEEIEPAYYYDGGKIPVFEPTMDQFRDFRRFIDKIDHYGMKSGIVKVVPPKEWTESLPALDEAVKTIKVKNPITQEFSGTHGTFTVANTEKQRSYNLPQWKALTDEPHHQPPARRGERRKQVEKPKPASTRTRASAANGSEEPPRKRPRGRPPRNQPAKEESVASDDEDTESRDSSLIRAPPTPTSPETKPERTPSTRGRGRGGRRGRGGNRGGGGGGRPKGATAKSVTERRKYNEAVKEEEIDHEAFENFDYRFEGNDEFTKERCAELEAAYWKGLTYAPPMYGADMPGGLFEESMDVWNVAHLPNLLDVLGTKVPGVNTAYLYLGMWKASFAWHLEDVDLYSINYIHFGAPKQWYSISQEDARKFEKVMKDVWPNDSKNCSQFLRHKTYLISPNLLKEKGITVNRLVHNEGEFVITYPYGYHSGYNLGYNCAESVNFANEAWLDYGKIAKKCECEADSVWVDVYDIERKLRGEPTPEYYEETDDEDDIDEETGLPSPPASTAGRKSQAGKRQRGPGAPKKLKKIKIRIRQNRNEPCCLCPNDITFSPLIATDHGKQAHEVCAQYTKETTIKEDETGKKIVHGIGNIDKARLELKCNLCRSKKGACFQCSEKKCVRAYHATCAAAAGVRVDFGPTPVMYDEDGTEFYQDLFDFRCRYHRNKRPNFKSFNPEPLETSKVIRRYVEKTQVGEVMQAQMLTNLGPDHKRLLGDIFAGTLVEKRPAEQTIVLDLLPEGDRFEVEYKWIMAPDLEESKQLKPSPNAKPIPPEMLEKIEESQNQGNRPPREDDVFTEGCTWGEFVSEHIPKNPYQVKIDLSKNNQMWHYLGSKSTETKASFTEDPNKKRGNMAANFLESVRPRYEPPPLSSRPLPPLQTTRQGPAYISNSVRPYPGPMIQPSSGPQPRYNHMTQPLQAKPGNMAPPQGPPNSIGGYYPAQRQTPYTQGLPYGSSAGRGFQPQYGAKSAQSPTNNAFPSMPPMANGQMQRRSSNASMSPPATPASSQAWSIVQPGSHNRSGSMSSQTPPMTGNANASASASSASTYQSHYSQMIDYLDHLKKYPYLKDAWMRRPKSYQPAYSASMNGGFAPRFQQIAAQARLGKAGVAGNQHPRPSTSGAPGQQGMGGVS